MFDSGTPQTIAAFLARTVASHGEEPALGSVRDGQVQWRTWREVLFDATHLAAVLEQVGVGRGDCVAQVSENRYEWIITDLAIHMVGAVHVPIHGTLSGVQIAEQIGDCGARLVFVSTRELWSRFEERVQGSVAVIVHDEQGTGQRPALLGKPAVAPEDLATILYTSGTTGRPRGVMLSQRNLATNAAAAAAVHAAGHDETRLCILPLSHIYARTCDLYTWVYRGSRLVLAESRETLARDCQLARPTALNAVPYLYHRIAEKIAAGGAADESAALGEFFGGRMERLSSGGAALGPDVEQWYASRGLPILQGYGLTEASPVISVSTFSANRFGSVGQPLPGVEVRVADDGEIVIRGPNVMLGYWQDPTGTADVIRDGWLHTGDLGELDDDNFLFIRGRKKELIVLSTGKKVLPTRVENLLTASPLVEQAAVFGDGQPALVALIVPAALHGESGTVDLTDERAKTSVERYRQEIDRCLRSAAHEEQVRHFRLLERPFSIERGELTPKLSLCRQAIERNFARELASMGSAAAVSSKTPAEQAPPLSK